VLTLQIQAKPRRPVRPALFLALALVSVSISACQNDPPLHRYPLKGTIVSVEPTAKGIVVAHEDIGGYMPAMTMPFPLKDEHLLDVLKPGDEIAATLVTARLTHWLEDVVVTRQAPAGYAPPTPAAAARVEASPGEAVPDVPLVGDDGHPFRLAELRGRAYAVTFVFTRCPLAEFCPRVTGLFADVEKELARDPALHARTALVSITFDPEHDTPEVLRTYAKPFRGPAATADRHWIFATGTPTTIQKIAEFFGVDYEPDGTSITHNLRTTVVGADGKVIRVFRGSDWSAAEVQAALATASAIASR
jgi:protein SCO1